MKILYGKLLEQEEFDKHIKMIDIHKTYQHKDFKGCLVDDNLDILTENIITGRFIEIVDEGYRIISGSLIVDYWYFSEILSVDEFKKEFPEEYI